MRELKVQGGEVGDSEDLGSGASARDRSEGFVGGALVVRELIDVGQQRAFVIGEDAARLPVRDSVDFVVAKPGIAADADVLVPLVAALFAEGSAEDDDLTGARREAGGALDG